MVYKNSTLLYHHVDFYSMNIITTLFAPPRKLRSSEWRHCYFKIRSVIQESAISSDVEYLQILLDLLVLIEIAFDIRNITDFDKYQFRFEYKIIKMSDIMWHVLKNVVPSVLEEQKEVYINLK